MSKFSEYFLGETCWINNRDFNIDQNKRDYDFSHHRAALGYLHLGIDSSQNVAGVKSLKRKRFFKIFFLSNSNQASQVDPGNLKPDKIMTNGKNCDSSTSKTIYLISFVWASRFFRFFKWTTNGDQLFLLIKQNLIKKMAEMEAWGPTCVFDGPCNRKVCI